jgi:uncharacterized membrane protein
VMAEAVTAGVNAGMAVTQTARARAEELLERSRTNTEHLAAMVRKEIASQLAAMGLATKADLADLEARLRVQRPPPADPATPPPGPTPPRAATRRTTAKATSKATSAPPPADAAEAAGAPPPGSAARGARRRPPST